MKKNVLIILLALIAMSCNSRPKFSLQNYMDDDADGLAYFEDDNVIRVPYSEKNGVKTIAVKINGTICTDMIFDSGCSESTISLKEAEYLFSIGKLDEDDRLGTSKATIADGTIIDNMVFNIKSLIIADKIECTDVTVTVSENAAAPLLLGNGVLDRVAKYTMDNVNKEIIFELE